MQERDGRNADGRDAGMKLKEGLTLEEKKGRYVLTEPGKRWRPSRTVLYMTDRTAYLWDYIQNHEFEKEDLVQMTLNRFADITHERAGEDMEHFLQELHSAGVLETAAGADRNEAAGNEEAGKEAAGKGADVI